jgi:hypothetical protein
MASHLSLVSPVRGLRPNAARLPFAQPSRRAAVEPVIGHTKAEHRMGRNYLKGRDGDRINAVLAAAGTTLASSCAGSEGFCAPCCRRSSQRSRIHNRPKTGRTLLLHERLVDQTVDFVVGQVEGHTFNVVQIRAFATSKPKGAPPCAYRIIA